MKISLVGDILLSKRIPSGYRGYKEIEELLSNADFNFANLESTVSNYEGYPAAFPGGGYSCMTPEMLDDVISMGFNIFNTANNHSMDYSCEGLLKTIENLKNRNIPFSGTGKNLATASRASYFDTSDGRIALIGITSSFHDSYMAGAQNEEMIGRPGVNPLRHREVYELNEDDFKNLERIVSSCGINNYHNQAIKEGYLAKPDNLKIGPYFFKEGVKGVFHSIPDENDLQRTIKTIKDSKFYSDLVMISIHSHQFENGNKQNTPEFISTFAHTCVDEGADVIVCHGPHCLRGIEIYKNKPIFYGLGNFIFQHEEQYVLPEEFYNKYGKTRQEVSGVGEIMNIRSKNNTVGLRLDEKVWDSVLIQIEKNKNDMKICLYPIDIQLNECKGLKGLPRLSDNVRIIEDVKKMSDKYDTEIIIKDNVGYISICEDY
ncbi:MAG: CapA family protein [Treponema sp.]|nr:CapA family protein [Treponema sp.]